MICSDFCNLLDNYESLSDEQRIEMENHISECETCRKEYEFFKSIISISASIPLPKAPDTLIDKVNAKLDAESARPVKIRWNFRVLSTVAACLAVGLAVGINNGYIKDNIENADTDGVIKETVVSTQKPEEAPIVADTDKAIEVKGQPKSETESAEDSTPKPQETEKSESTVRLAPSVKPSPTEAPAPVKTTQEPVATQAPSPEPTTVVDSYSIKEEGSKTAYRYYELDRSHEFKSPMSDYLHVESNDMGAVVSTMSEMGIKYGSGYYMTPRENFYAFIERLESKGIEYDCDIRYSSGDGIVFRLTYN